MKFLLLLTFIGFSQLFGQTLIKGTVVDKNQKPIHLANVFLEGTYDGTTTDSLGNFIFETLQKGTKTLKVSVVGRPLFSKIIEIPTDEKFIIQLSETDNRLNEVVIQAGMLQANSSGKNTVMSPLDIVTTAGSMGNVIGALATLPGAQVAGENGRLMVHGGNANETQTYINGIRVPQPYTSSPNEIPTRGRFSPFLFNGVNFSTGGYSAEFGNALSSILALETQNKIETPKSEFSISSVGLGASNTSRWGKNSLSINSSYTNLKPYSKIITPNILWSKPYENASGEMVYRHQFNSGFLNIYAAFTFENMGLYQSDINYSDQVHVRKESQNTYINADYTQDLGNRWVLESGIGYGNLIDKTHYDVNYIPNKEKALHIKEKLNKTWSNRIKSIFGIEYFDTNFSERFENSTQNVSYGYRSKMGTGFTETSIAILPNLIAKLGVRGTISNLQSKNIIEPRISFGYAPNKLNQFSFAYGDFHQQAAQNILKFSPELDWTAAKHYIFNYFFEKNGKTLRLETYNKTYSSLIKYNTATPTYNSQYLSNGNGKVNGVDLFFRDNSSVKNLQYWVSYAYTDSKRNEANYSSSVTPSYVFKHSFSLVGKYWFSSIRSQLSITNTYLSGRSYNDPNTNEFMSGKTKGYNNLSMSWSYLISQQKIIHLSVSNVLGSSPIYGYQYANQINDNGIYARRAIVPTAKRFVFIGYFWTISRDKDDNQLNKL